MWLRRVRGGRLRPCPTTRTTAAARSSRPPHVGSRFPAFATPRTESFKDRTRSTARNFSNAFAMWSALRCSCVTILSCSLLPESRSSAVNSSQLRCRPDDLAHDAVRHGLLRTHPMVSIGVFRNAFEGLASLFGDDSIDPFARLDDLFRLDLDVGGVAAEPTRGLVNQESRVR